MTVSDEDLMDYADGILDQGKASEVERAIGDDPELQEKVELFRTSFSMAAAADDYAQSTFPTLDEIETELATRPMAVIEKPAKFGLLQTLRAKIIVAMVSVSVTFAGGVAATVGFVGWRVQQALMSFQTVGQAAAPMITRGSDHKDKFSSQPIWYVAGPLSMSVEVFQRRQVGGENFVRPIGYLRDGDSVPIGRVLRVSYRVDERKFLDAQGFKCLIMGNCKTEGRLSLSYRSGTQLYAPLADLPVTFGEAQILSNPGFLRVTKPAGTDVLRFQLRFSDQLVEREIKIKISDQ